MLDDIDALQLLGERPEAARFPGALFTGRGPKAYVGSALAVAGTLYFHDAHLPAVRDAICRCFDEFAALAGAHLRWLWREDAPEGPPRIPYAQAKPMREYMARMNANDAVSFTYTSGENPEDAGEYSFAVNGWRKWEAEMGTWGLCSLRFSLPITFPKTNPIGMQSLFVSFARHLKAAHGYAGPALILSAVRRSENEPFEARMSETVRALDVGSAIGCAREAAQGIKGVGWLTAINSTMVAEVGGINNIQAECPPKWFALYGYGAGFVIQAGPEPVAASTKTDPLPALYVLPNALLRQVRMRTIEALHQYPKDGEPRIVGAAADAWLRRFDVPDTDLLQYRRKLLTEPALTPASVLPGGLA